MEHGLPGELRLLVHPLFADTGSSDDVLFRKGPPTPFEVTDATILKDSMAILTRWLA